MPGCVFVPQQGVFASGVIRFLDCEAQSIGQAGYQALAAANSPVGIALTGMLTLFVALIGYRMLLGETPSVRDGVLAMVKIGVVLALATGWPAYRTLVYDVVIGAPGELVAAVGTPAGVPGADGGLLARLDFADQAFDQLAVAGVGPRVAPPGGEGGEGEPTALPTAPPLFAGFDTFAIGAARAIFLAGAIGALGFARLGAGLLLALGPLFLAFLLFHATRGLFEGWARGLIGAALVSFAAALVLGVELALIEPWLAVLIAERSGGQPITGVSVQLLAVATVFAILLAVIAGLVVRVAMGLRLPAAWAWNGGGVAAGGGGAAIAARGAAGPGGAAAMAEERSRALRVADALQASQRREAGPASPAMPAAAAAAGRAPGAAAQARDGVMAAATPIGQSARRRTAGRVSAGSGRRDRRG